MSNIKETLKGEVSKEKSTSGKSKESEKIPSHRIRMKGLNIKRPQTTNPEKNASKEPDKVSVKKEDMSDTLKTFMEEHKAMMKVIEEFEKGIVDYKLNGYDLKPEINESFSNFFKCFDEELLPHNSKEEKILFPILHKKLIQAGQHSTGEKKITAVDIMEDDHVKFIQLGALSFNLLGLSTRMADERSRFFVLDTAYDTSRELIELLKLHLYREDESLFPLAQKYISKEEFKVLQEEMKKF